MKKLLHTLLLALGLAIPLAACDGDQQSCGDGVPVGSCPDAVGSCPDAGGSDPDAEVADSGAGGADQGGVRERGPTPDLPAGQMWEMIEAQMATMRGTQSLVRDSFLDEKMITVMVCGSNSPLPTTPGAQSCTAVFVNGQFLLFDAGDGAQRSMEDLNLPVADLSAVFITHYHNDHMADLGEVIQRSWVNGRRHHLPVYGGTGLTQIIEGIEQTYEIDYRVRQAHHGADFLPADAVATIPLPFDVAAGESVVVYENDGVVVTAFDVHHPPVEPAVGYTVTYQGKRIVISGDTADTETLHEQSRGADVLVADAMNHEALRSMEAISAKNGWDYNATIFHDIRDYHIDVNELAALAEESGVGTLVLTHMIPTIDNDLIRQMWYRTPIQRQFTGNLMLAHDGSSVQIRLENLDGHELITEHYESGAVRSETPYVDGVKDGTALTWYENGDLRRVVDWTMGTGRAIEYAPNGALMVPSVHPEYAGRTFELDGARALIITTSVSTLGEGGAATGVFASEMTAPYYEFLDAGMEVDVASIEGGAIPVDPLSFLPNIISSYDERYLRDDAFQAKTGDALRIDDLDFTAYDVVYMAGGWGAAYDLGVSPVLGEGITAAYRAGIPLGAVCHGSLGFLNAVDENGAPLVEGRRMTGVTDKQVRELGIEITPQHPETELRNAGAIFESLTSASDFLANYVVADGRIVTGQNQNGSAETAQRLMELVEAAQ
ncbi:MBL fold metallo-hydrolase [Myxococcota bacterium]|nr:MBL fold metallo-hydrolase [Myxococcota bacterium]MBU1898651.1 MBL fold metallo-hydrolase [Myxococcota bacterium]